MNKLPVVTLPLLAAGATSVSAPATDRPWRSLDHREQTPASRALVNDEFPHNTAMPVEEQMAAEGSGSGWQRRDALKLMGATFALAGVGTGCVRRPEELILPYTRMPEHVIPGRATYYATAIPGPNGAIGVLAESHEGRPTKVEGNPDHPQSLGRADAQMQSFIIELYDPDRSRTPVKATMPAGWLAWDKEELPAIVKQAEASAGRGLAFLLDGSGGPTQERVLGEMQRRYPQAQVFEYDPLRHDNTLAGTELAFGAGTRVSYELDRAKVVLSLDSDFLVDGPEHLRRARGFGLGRSWDRVPSARQAEEMNRLYVVESVFSVTGSSADHRVRVPASQVASFAKALAAELSRQGLALPASLAAGTTTAYKAPNEKFIPALARDLLKNRGRAVILVGERQPLAVHALGNLLNAALDAYAGQAPVARLTRAFPSIAGMQMPVQADGEQAPAARPHETSVAQLTRLTQALNAGEIETLFIVGANPAYAAPRESGQRGELGFAGALGKAKRVVHVGLYYDETAALAHWHLPMAHPLESWGDTAAYDGTLTVTQPLILPLFGGRSALEVLAQVAGIADTSARALVESTWKASHRISDSAWRQLLHDGATQRAHRQPVEAGALDTEAGAARAGQALGQLKDPTGDDIEAVFVYDNTLKDGRYANVGWLQELPDPMTKLCWDNAAIIGPALARRLQVKGEMSRNVYMADVVRIEIDGKSAEIPVFVLPGVEANTVMLPLGYGRTRSGEVGTGIGVDLYPLLPASGQRFVRGVKITRTGRTTDLCSTQDHFSVEDGPIQEMTTMSLGARPLAPMATVAAYKEDPTYAKSAANIGKNLVEKARPQVAHQPLKPIQPYRLNVTEEEWVYDGQAWGMTIDLTACIACGACTVACQAENIIPVVGRESVTFGREMHWIRIDRYFTGDVDEPTAISQPVPCMHCENAPCEPVCPVAATVHDEEGLNAMVYNRCIGTRYCANNCPYKVRRFNFFDFTHSGNLYVDPHVAQRMKVLKLQRNPDVTVRYRGVMEKCTYCTQRIQQAKYEAKRQGKDPRNLADGAIVPACAQTCPTNAIVFGNINGKGDDGKPSAVAQRKSSDRNYEMLSELNTRPRTTFLAKLRNTNPELV
jgi:MoCo/4Fe-4S cofactor protein with predicted Tat translocation signal